MAIGKTAALAARGYSEHGGPGKSEFETENLRAAGRGRAGRGRIPKGVQRFSGVLGLTCVSGCDIGWDVVGVSSLTKNAGPAFRGADGNPDLGVGVNRDGRPTRGGQASKTAAEWRDRDPFGRFPSTSSG